MSKWLKKRLAAHAFIALSIFALWLTLDHFEFTAASIERAEFSTMDERNRLGRLAPINPDLFFLAIDAPSVSLDALDPDTIANSRPLSLMKAGFPYSREVYGEIADRVLSAGARVVAFDLIFQTPKPGDQFFRHIMDKYPNQIVIGFDYKDGNDSFDLPPTSLLPSNDFTDEQVGYFNYWPDTDGVIRRVYYRMNLEKLGNKVGAEKLPMAYSLAARMAEKAGYGARVPNDMNERFIRFADTNKHRVNWWCSVYQIFDPLYWRDHLQNGAFFKDKIVLVGPEGNWSKDVLGTPWGNLAGAEIHLNAANAILENQFLLPPSKGLTIGLVLLATAIAFFIAALLPGIASRFVVALLILGGYGAVLLWAYNSLGWLLPAVSPVGVFCGTTGLGYIYDFVLVQLEKFQLRATFERYTSPNEANYLLNNPGSYKRMLAGIRKPVTILFSDIRGFTAMTEKTDSSELVAKLNEYLTVMVDCVFYYDGSLDKFIGDAIVAIWGKTPYNFGPKEDAIRAVRAALAMFAELDKLNSRWVEEGRAKWKIGIGLNHGEVIVGDIGSPRRKEFAVIGDPVNLASRLESLTKDYKVNLLMGESLAVLVRDQFYLQTVDLIQVLGKTQTVDTFTVLGEKNGTSDPALEKFLEAYEEGVRMMRRRSFELAKRLFTEALQFRSGDLLATQCLASCEEFLLHPPDDSWSGVRVMTKK